VGNSRVAVVFGTRPEIVKLAPVIGALREPPTLIHTGQHYDEQMVGAFLDAFGLPEPDHVLDVGGETRGQQIGKATSGLDSLFENLRPLAVVAQGDTNSTMAAALAANARSIPIAHVEAGLRSFDRAMPEEHNRVVTDHLSDLCLAPTQTALGNLKSEGIPNERVVITGNTVVDAVLHLVPSVKEPSPLLNQLDVARQGFVLSTFHRPENVDHPDHLETIVDQLERLEIPVLLPLHPRTKAVAHKHGVDLERGAIKVSEPLGYIDFLGLLAEAALVVADSGGLQEEVSVLKKPMVVVRNSTERPEVLGTFCTLVQVGRQISEAGRAWLDGSPYPLDELARMPSPYGEGDSGARSAVAIEGLVAAG